MPTEIQPAFNIKANLMSQRILVSVQLTLAHNYLSQKHHETISNNHTGRKDKEIIGTWLKPSPKATSSDQLEQHIYLIHIHTFKMCRY